VPKYDRVHAPKTVGAGFTGVLLVDVQTRFDSAAVNSDVMNSALPDGSSVLLHLETELYFGLNQVGAVLWDALQKNESYESTATKIQSQFDVERSRVDADTAALLDQLDAKDLLTHDA